MHITSIKLHPYTMPLPFYPFRKGALLSVIDQEGRVGQADVAPLPGRSKETLEDCIEQCKTLNIQEINWTKENCLQELAKLQLLPALSFGLESALFSILWPIKHHRISSAAFFMGTKEQILSQAKRIHTKQKKKSAKLKISHLSSIEETLEIVKILKDDFYLRIDINRAWQTEECLKFFSNFSTNAFDYIEEPFKNVHDLPLFSHPFAIDESLEEKCVSLQDLETFPLLKAIIYKPTIQGGTLFALPLYEWAKKNHIQLILSSSFESKIGLNQISQMAVRFNFPEPLGIGTFYEKISAQKDSR